MDNKFSYSIPFIVLVINALCNIFSQMSLFSVIINLNYCVNQIEDFWC